MENEISAVMRAANCTRESAIHALKISNRNIPNAIDIAKRQTLYTDGASSGLCVEEAVKLFKYKNGILLNDTFYDFNNPKYAHLKPLIENNEFDADILNKKDGDTMAFDVVDLSNENFVIKNETQAEKRMPFQDVGRTLGNKPEIVEFPDSIEIGKANVRFKIMTSRKKVNVKADSEMTISEFCKYLKKEFNISGTPVIKKDNKVVEGHERLNFVKMTLITLDIVGS